jgi:asparagine synthase (glutamine-hydrolysing)
MAHGLEVRSPFLDHHLVEWLASVPTHLKLQGNDGKRLLKRALTTRLPFEVLARPKAGFAVPLDEWLRGPLKDEAGRALDSDILLDSQIFNRAALQSASADHQSGRRDNSGLIWAVMMFEASMRHLEVQP